MITEPVARPRGTPRFSSATRSGCTQIVSTRAKNTGPKMPEMAAMPNVARAAPPKPIRM